MVNCHGGAMGLTCECHSTAIERPRACHGAKTVIELHGASSCFGGTFITSILSMCALLSTRDTGIVVTTRGGCESVASCMAVTSRTIGSQGRGTRAWPYHRRPSHHYNAGTGHVGFSPTRQALRAPSAKHREAFCVLHER